MSSHRFDSHPVSPWAAQEHASYHPARLGPALDDRRDKYKYV